MSARRVSEFRAMCPICGLVFEVQEHTDEVLMALGIRPGPEAKRYAEAEAESHAKDCKGAS